MPFSNSFTTLIKFLNGCNKRITVHQGLFSEDTQYSLNTLQTPHFLQAMTNTNAVVPFPDFSLSGGINLNMAYVHTLKHSKNRGLIKIICLSFCCQNCLKASSGVFNFVFACLNIPWLLLYVKVCCKYKQQQLKNPKLNTGPI